ncbi:MAG: hypothetical protein RIR86_2294 [Acidobacteriota bacterium]
MSLDSRPPGHAGAVDEDVDPPILRGDLLDQCADGRLIGDIAREDSSAGADLDDRFLQHFALQIDHGHLGAFARQPLRDRQAKACPRTCDHCHLPLELISHLVECLLENRLNRVD